jgi:glycerol-3-phosphate cytidylyltransferase
MKTIITYGTFDLFHIGHVRLLERARALGDRLVVGISTDAFNAAKGKRSVMSYEHRAGIIHALACVDEIFPEDDWEQKEGDIFKFKASVLVMGDDWRGKFDHLKSACDVVYLPRTVGISTTEVKKALSALKADTITELQRGLDALQSVVAQLAD